MPQPDRHPELPLDPDRSDTDGLVPDRPLHLRPSALALVALGGFLGALARYWVTVIEPTRPGCWPVGTLTVNLVGAAILGVLLEAVARRGPDTGWRRNARLLIGTGFCGALTTYSTLAVEADLLVRDHRTGIAVGYLVVSVLGGLALTSAGIAAATGQHRWVRRRGSRA